MFSIRIILSLTLMVLLLIDSSFSACVPSAEQCGCSKIKPLTSQTKIVGGYTALTHSWPWMGTCTFKY